MGLAVISGWASVVHAFKKRHVTSLRYITAEKYNLVTLVVRRDPHNLMTSAEKKESRHESENNIEKNTTSHTLQTCSSILGNLCHKWAKVLEYRSQVSDLLCPDSAPTDTEGFPVHQTPVLWWWVDHEPLGDWNPNSQGELWCKCLPTEISLRHFRTCHCFCFQLKFLHS